MLSSASDRNAPLEESQLEGLLRELLDNAGTQHPAPGLEASSDIAELRDAARRIRAATQWMPLPEGRRGVRHALLATAEQNWRDMHDSRAPWRRARLWLGTVVVALIAGGFGFGAAALSVGLPPGTPVDGFRLMLDKARGALAPARHPVVQYALNYRFPAVQLPAGQAVTTIAEGKVGGLPATLTLRTAPRCATAASCGTFVVSLAKLSASASTKFGQLSGAFACDAHGCTLTLAKATGVFARAHPGRLSMSRTGASEGQFATGMAFRGEWLAGVAMAGAVLESDGLLPAELTVSDLVADAATNERVHQRSSGPGGTVRDGGAPVVGPGPKTSSAVPGGETLSTQGRGLRGSRKTDGGDSGSSGLNRGTRPGARPDTTVGVRSGDATAVPNGHGRGLGNGGPFSSEDDPNPASGPGSGGVGGGTSINGTGTTGSGGGGVNGGVTSGSGGVSVNGGVTAGSGGVGVNGGVTAGSGGVGAGGGANVSGGATAGSGGVGTGGGANVNGGATAGGGGVGTGGGANVNGGATAGSGVGTGGGANLNGGATAGTTGAGTSGGVGVTGGATSGTAGVNVGGGVSVNGGGINVGGGAVGGGGGSGTGSSRDNH